jgi:hypothetical protein
MVVPITSRGAKTTIRNNVDTQDTSLFNLALWLLVIVSRNGSWYSQGTVDYDKDKEYCFLFMECFKKCNQNPNT